MLTLANIAFANATRRYAIIGVAILIVGFMETPL